MNLQDMFYSQTYIFIYLYQINNKKNRMRKLLIFSILYGISSFTTQAKTSKLVLASPNAQLVIESTITPDGKPVYTVKNNNQTVLLQSALGLISDLGDFSRNVKITKITAPKQVTETYTSPAEKRAVRTYTANYASITLKNIAGKTLNIEFKATNDGVAFRYLQTSKTPIAVKAEQTSFKFAPTSRAWLHPHADAETGWCQTQPSYEEQYEYDMSVGTAAPMKAGWSFPALFKTGDNWVLLTEAGLTPDYVGTRLTQQSAGGEYTIGFPQKGEMMKDDDPNYVISANVTSPWRVIVVGSLATVV